MVANANYGSAALPGLEERILDTTALGDSLFQCNVDRLIAQCQKRCLGLTASIDFRRGSGASWALDRQTPRPDARWVTDATAETDCDTGCDNMGYVRVEFPYKRMFACGKITRDAIKRGRGFADVLALELEGITDSLVYTLEKDFFQGNFDGSTPESITGIFALLLDYNGTTPGQPVQIIHPPDADPVAGTPGTLQLKTLDRLLNLIKKGPRRIYLSKSGMILINDILQSQERFVGTSRIQAGFDVVSYRQAALIETDGIGDEMVFGGTVAAPTITALTGGDSTAIVAINSDEVFIGELEPATVAQMSETCLLHSELQGTWCGTVVLRCPEGGAMIIGVNPAC